MRKRLFKFLSLAVLAVALGFIPFVSKEHKAFASGLSITATQAKNVTETNATVYGAVSYWGSRPSSVGIYFGTDPNSLTWVASDNIRHNKNPFDMWYDLNAEAGKYLQPGTTYYYQCYAIQDGVTHTSNIASFTTPGYVAPAFDSAVHFLSAPASQINITVKNPTINGTSAKLIASYSYSGTRPASVGVCLGTDQNNLKAIDSDRITHSKNPFDAWYTINNLTKGQTYYYCFYAVDSNNQTIYSSTESFKIAGPCSHVYNDWGNCQKCGTAYPLNITPMNQKATALKHNGALHAYSPYGIDPITARLVRGEELTVVGKTTNCFGNTWYQVKKAGSNSVYWVVYDYIQLGEVISTESGTTDVAGTFKKAIMFYNQAKGTNVSSFASNQCVNTTWFQMYALGIVNEPNRPSINREWNGKDWYNNYKYLEECGATTSTGYKIKTYAGEDGFKNLINEYAGRDLYNVAVCFPCTTSNGQVSYTYGHIVFIHAIKNNQIYFTDCYSGWFGTRNRKSFNVYQGQTNVVSVDEFLSFYRKYNGTMNGAIHFTK